MKSNELFLPIDRPGAIDNFSVLLADSRSMWGNILMYLPTAGFSYGLIVSREVTIVCREPRAISIYIRWYDRWAGWFL